MIPERSKYSRIKFHIEETIVLPLFVGKWSGTAASATLHIVYVTNKSQYSVLRYYQIKTCHMSDVAKAI